MPICGRDLQHLALAGRVGHLISLAPRDFSAFEPVMRVGSFFFLGRHLCPLHNRNAQTGLRLHAFGAGDWQPGSWPPGRVRLSQGGLGPIAEEIARGIKSLACAIKDAETPKVEPEGSMSQPASYWTHLSSNPETLPSASSAAGYSSRPQALSAPPATMSRPHPTTFLAARP